MAFSVFGGVINGFQRYDLNNVVGTVSSIVDGAGQRRRDLLAGYGLVGLVVATTVVRLLTYWVYRAERLSRVPGAAHAAVALPPRASARGDARSASTWC